MKQLSTLLLIFSLSLLGLSAQNTVQVKWYSFEEAVELAKKNPKKIFIDVYTDWCGWCKKMDQETFSNPVIANYLNEHFYPVKLNSETTDTIHFEGHRFVNEGQARRSAHQLSISLLQGKMSYPSVVYMSENFQLITVVPGYMNASAIEPVLKFISENHYQRISYDDFQRNFTSSISDQ
jgi:thioredoxin-related protein